MLPCNISMGEENFVVDKTSGASLVDHRALFSFDSKCLFCCTGNSVKVFSTASGECIHVLTGHTGQVTGVQIHPKNKLQLLSCSVDQTIIKWDYSDGVLLQKYQLHCPLYGILSEHLCDNSVIVIQEPSSKNFQVVRFSLSPEQKEESSQSHVLFKTAHHNENRVAIGCKGEYVATVHDKTLEIFSFKKNKYQSHELPSRTIYTYTCIACHPTEYCIATGTSHGQIIFWWHFMSKDKVVKSVSHWHSLSVLDLSFSTEGSYLLSGGYECVLVKWQYNSHYKTFLPRLGSPINHVTCSSDNLMYATSHQDNAIRIISSNFKLLQVYQGLTKCHRYGKSEVKVHTGMLCDPRTKALVMNGQPGHLQFYSVHTDRQLYNLDIVQQNYISPNNLNCPPQITEVTNAAFDNRGEWLATFEHLDDEVMSPELRLKFWLFNDKSQAYVLNTVVEMPHEGKVNSLIFRPEGVVEMEYQPTVVSSSIDGKFKTWKLIDDTDIYRSNNKWSCELVGYYRNKPAGPCCFAEDGSLLAVVFESTITVWEPDDNILRETFIDQVDNTHIRALEFGRKSCCHLLISVSSSTLKCWNLLSCSVQWVVDLQCDLLIADPKSDLMAVVTSDQSLFIFKPSSNDYLYCQRDLSTNEILGGVFLPHTQESSHDEDVKLPWQQHSQLYLLNKDQELFTLTRKDSVAEDANRSKQKISVKENLPKTPFSILMHAEKKRSGVTNMDTSELESATTLPSGQYIQQHKASMNDEDDSDEDDVVKSVGSDSSDSDMEEDITDKREREMDKNHHNSDNTNDISDTKTIQSVCNNTCYNWYSSVMSETK
ncbi:hypothetical protein KUTeg_008498 [Tegillarca granosa]|uniref:WD repeat-containing protein 75 second beta-propeller domain-containing protein n=1 Tax=Tegillarca granosa TaxID=220873 RepID=A0ABQ9FC01_TEGGR|nr:hypothetical protein KUTeg_008498 [Tegillarca granosa]